MEEQTISIIEQLVQIIGLQSNDLVIYDIMGFFFLLVVSLICYNLIFTFVSIFLRRD